MLRFGIPLLMLAGGFTLQAAGDWPRFRGPDGSGLSDATNLPLRWSGSNFTWRTPIPGKGHSSPVTWKDSIYLTSGNDTNAERYIVCVRQSNGSIHWQKQYASQKFTHHRENSFGTSTPAVDENGVYVYWTTPDAITVAAFAHDGQEKWLRKLGPFNGKHGSGASPVAHNGLIWINNDQDGPSSLLALDAKTGATKYNIPRKPDKVSYGTPTVLRSQGGPVELIFAASSHGLTSVNPLTGAVNWDCTNLFAARVVSSPITSEGLIICSSGEGGTGRRLVAIKPPVGAGEAAVVYDIKRDVPNVPTPLATDGRLYLLCDNGTFRCLNAQTGEPVWQERLGARFYASPIAAQKRLYLTSVRGDVFVVATGDKYELLAQNQLGEPTFATPAIANNTLFFRTESSLIAIR